MVSTWILFLLVVKTFISTSKLVPRLVLNFGPGRQTQPQNLHPKFWWRVSSFIINNEHAAPSPMQNEGKMFLFGLRPEKVALAASCRRCSSTERQIFASYSSSGHPCWILLKRCCRNRSLWWWQGCNQCLSPNSRKSNTLELLVLSQGALS